MSSTPAKFAFAFLAALSALGGGTCSAQTGYMFSSVEWLTASSDVVVRGTVVDLAFQDGAPETPGKRSEIERATVTLKVTSTLKGKAPDVLTFVHDQSRGSKILSDWKKSEVPVLWFLVENADDGKGGKNAGKLRLRENRLIGASAVDLGAIGKEGKVPRALLTMELKALDREAAILDAVKAVVKARGLGRETEYVYIPIRRELALLTGEAGDGNTLIVPAVESPVRIEIAADKKEYPFRGAIRLTVTYTNTSKEAVELHANGTVGPDTGLDCETYEVTAGDGLRQYRVHAKEPAKWRMTLEPGKSWKRELELAVVLSGAREGKDRGDQDPLPDPFGRLDEYKVRLTWGGGMNVKSKPVYCEPVGSNTVKFRVGG